MASAEERIMTPPGEGQAEMRAVVSVKRVRRVGS